MNRYTDAAFWRLLEANYPERQLRELKQWADQLEQLQRERAAHGWPPVR
jgi:hypothetical protein